MFFLFRYDFYKINCFVSLLYQIIDITEAYVCFRFKIDDISTSYC
jgi:hypothetical protein